MVKERFRVVGKMKISSQKGNYYAVHLVAHFTSTEVEKGATGDKAIVTMVRPEEFEGIKLGIYEGYLMQSGRFTNVIFQDYIGGSDS